MCGILGWQAESFDVHGSLLALADDFLKVQHHRGPDSNGFYEDASKNLALGHNRLSILELSSLGHQPMVGNTGNVLSFNGEIYNYQEIKTELISHGLSFKSRSDTEVLLAALDYWGMQALDKICGMYAFAYWHKQSSTLYLVRDPLGIKPLYYWKSPNRGIVFASEVNSFGIDQQFKRQLNTQSLAEYLDFGYVIDERNTIFSEVSKVAPGQYIKIQNANIIESKKFYSSDQSKSNQQPTEDIVDLLHETLREVVEQHFVADVPVGLLLSGGLDSSLIASLASQRRKIHTFSMGFADSGTEESVL